MAYKYDPILRMNVPVMTTDGYKVKATGKADTLEEAKKFLSKQGKNIEYSRARKSGSKYYFDNAIGDDVGEWDSSSKVVKAYDEKTWDHAIQAADAFVPADEALLKQIEYKLKNLGWTINSKQKYSMHGGSFHYQMTYKEKIDPKNEAQFMKIAKPAADVIDREAKDYEPTFNFGLGKDGSVTCGFDIRSKYVRE